MRKTLSIWWRHIWLHPAVLSVMMTFVTNALLLVTSCITSPETLQEMYEMANVWRGPPVLEALPEACLLHIKGMVLLHTTNQSPCYTRWSPIADRKWPACSGTSWWRRREGGRRSQRIASIADASTWSRRRDPLLHGGLQTRPSRCWWYGALLHLLHLVSWGLSRQPHQTPSWLKLVAVCVVSPHAAYPYSTEWLCQ